MEENLLNNEKQIQEIENEIKNKVQQYVNAQKKYNGDSALSKKIEAEVDSLEIKLKILKGNKK